ncbi:DUF1990 family protein [Leucobacter soli]|uniref:DUF1990 domain-containing protein n=1 Tax=Leucobacter soli TaxID=2812850 RepID=A0A916JS88_9MICO|nr:DUF1990 family protein [Leucobacter soli]CAG7596384.1 hypothetical protein LEUCIP111803_00084 [Leucobacter soli]
MTAAESDGPDAAAGPQRRSTHIDQGAVYAAVGASAAPDLMRFPPEGSTPYELEVRLGSGSDRFLVASTAVMTWRAQRGVGIRVKNIAQGDGGQYSGIAFDDRGTPQPVAVPDMEYGPDGEPFVTAGTEVTLHWPEGRAPRRYRVVYTISEPRRIGFAWGAADEEDVVGEECFVVEHREDDTVWAIARGFLWPPPGGRLPGKGKSAIKRALKASRAQLDVLVTGVLPTGD